MKKPKVVIVRAPGINCDLETVRAWTVAGAECDLVHLDRIIERPATIDDYDILTFPGGFSYGDDVSAGRIFANKIVHYLADQLRDFIARDRLVLGICNGFQILAKAGLLVANDRNDPCSLILNDSGQFICRWVSVRCECRHSCFLEYGRDYFLPIANAEGKFAVADMNSFDQKRVALRYVSGPPREGPINPNGSFADVAALTDPSGRVLGMMPHPERFVDRLQHPFWTTLSDVEPCGLAIFRAAVSRFR